MDDVSNLGQTPLVSTIDMGILTDLRYAARRLRQRPGLLITALLTLALGIGFNALVFGFVDTFLLKPLPIPEPDQVVSITFGEKQHPNTSYPNYLDIRDRNQVFSDVAAERVMPMALSGAIRNVRIWGYEVSGTYFHLVGVKPWRGRFLQPSDDNKAGANPVAVISYGCWQRRFGADPGAVGKSIRINGHPFTVVGITPPGFRGTERWFPPDVWVPMSMVRAVEDWDWREDRASRNIWVIARLRPGIGATQAEASLRVLAAQMAKEHPDVNEGFRMGMAPPGLLGATLRGAFIGIGTALLLVSGLTLLVACANLSGLLLAHAAARRKEIAIRYAIGAGRGAVLRMLLSESLLIALGGGVLGIVTGTALAGIIDASKPVFDFPIDASFGIDWRVAGFAMALSVVSAALFGLLPGLRASRVDVAPVLKSDMSGGRTRHWTLRDVFVGVQVAVCMVLVAGALMMVKTLRTTLTKNFGFEPAGAVTLRFDLAMQGYSQDRGVEFQRRLLDRVRALPGVEAAGLADRLPLSIENSGSKVSVEGAPVVPFARLPEAVTYDCGPGFFRSMGTRMVRGRDIDARDTAKSPRVAIVNQIFAEKLLAGRDPLGSRFRFGNDGGWIQIAGVVQSGKYQTIGEDPEPALWIPLAQDYSPRATLVVRSGHADAALLATVRHAVEELDPDVTVYDAKTLREHLDVPLTPLRWTTAVLTAMGAVVLFLAALGLYGILSYTTGRRTREIGIRLALGGQAYQILTPLLARTTVIVLLAAGIGLLASVPVTRLLAGLLSGETDIMAQLLSVAVLGISGLLASLIPVRRALRVDPAEALRQE